jgi:hypothetical protein
VPLCQVASRHHRRSHVLQYIAPQKKLFHKHAGIIVVAVGWSLHDSVSTSCCPLKAEKATTIRTV